MFRSPGSDVEGHGIQDHGAVEAFPGLAVERFQEAEVVAVADQGIGRAGFGVVGMMFAPEEEEGVGEGVGEGGAVTAAEVADLFGADAEARVSGGEEGVGVEGLDDVEGVVDAAEVGVGEQDEEVVGFGGAGGAAEQFEPGSAAGAVGGGLDEVEKVGRRGLGGEVLGEGGDGAGGRHGRDRGRGRVGRRFGIREVLHRDHGTRLAGRADGRVTRL